ncbi:hypothetical protein ACYFX5_03310 [Bremerella sp. T1]|uniref:hypothetical protein n=1 Tax=Bremerella sp. TYQ1 TaxID=3119568 RepID=UPI001CCF9F4E|nr:hypothetical protein [Bremerella volcania]UBM37299.1 hypothetical protein LA756_05265 [Bremerella volcania]
MTNPYQSPKEKGSEPIETDSLPIGRAVLGGTIWALGSAFPIAALMVTFFRFPIPLGGIVTGPQFIPHAMGAVMFYGIILGGFFVLVVLGVVAGLMGRMLGSKKRNQSYLGRGLAVAATFTALMILATLDWVIGPW